jgi:hypothetical protein
VLRLGLRQRGLERALVDGEQGIADGDDLAVGEVNLLEVAADPGADLDLVDGLEAADELVVLHDVPQHRLRHRHRRRRLLRLLRPALALLLAGGNGQHQAKPDADPRYEG